LAARKSLGIADVRLALCYSEDAIAKIQDCEYDAAIKQILMGQDIDKALGLYPYNWLTEANLGLAYTLQGKLPEADEALSSILERREAMFGYMDNRDFGLAFPR